MIRERRKKKENFRDCLRISKTTNNSKPNNKGITLIALIITIIVMLILVGVTVNVALNGGLFNTAKKGTYQTEVIQIKDQLQVAKATKLAENNGVEPVNFGITMENLGLSDKLKNKYLNKLIISKNAELYYKSETVTDEEERKWLEEIGITVEDKDIDVLKNYFLGVDRSGRNFVGEIMDLDNLTFKHYEEIQERPEDGLEFLQIAPKSQDTISDFYIKYNRKLYAVQTKFISEEVYLTQEVKCRYIPSGREGEDLGDVTGIKIFNGITILYDYGDSVEAAFGTVGLNYEIGAGDKTINWGDSEVIAEADLDNNKTLDYQEKRIYSYNNAVKTINNICKDEITKIFTKIPRENVRSAGSNPYNPYSENEDKYTSKELETLEGGKYNGKIKKSDDNLEEDYIRMCYYGVAKSERSYYMASRHTAVTDPSTKELSFDMKGIANDGSISFYGPGGLESSGYANLDVRPIIKMQISK